MDVQNADFAYSRYNDARAALNRHDLTGAKLALLDSWYHEPHGATAYQLSHVFSSLGDQSSSEYWLFLSFLTNPNQSKIAVAYAQKLFSSGRSNSAARICIDVLTKNATFAPARVLLSSIARHVGVDVDHILESNGTSWLLLRYPETAEYGGRVLPGAIFEYEHSTSKMPLVVTVLNVSSPQSPQVARAIGVASTAAFAYPRDLLAWCRVFGLQNVVLFERAVLAAPGWRHCGTLPLPRSMSRPMRACFVDYVCGRPYEFRLDSTTLECLGTGSPINLAKTACCNARRLLESYVSEDIAKYLMFSGLYTHNHGER